MVQRKDIDDSDLMDLRSTRKLSSSAHQTPWVPCPLMDHTWTLLRPYSTLYTSPNSIYLLVHTTRTSLLKTKLNPKGVVGPGAAPLLDVHTELWLLHTGDLILRCPPLLSDQHDQLSEG